MVQMATMDSGGIPRAAQGYAAVIGGGRGDGAVVPASEEDGERKEVVREHQCHTTRAADALMRMERPYVALAMCEWQKQQHSEIGMVALAHLRRDLQWS
jgi:hypothetical protein